MVSTRGPGASEVILIVGCECARPAVRRQAPEDSGPCPKCDGKKYTEARFGSLAEMQAFAVGLRIT
jgi:hypothetical protein